MMTHDAADFAFAAARGTPGETVDSFDLHEIHGTAVPIAPQLFLTAAHVATAITGSHTAVVGQLDDHGFTFYPVIDFELFEDVDLAIVKALSPVVKSVEWLISEQPLTTDVMAVGYPYALDKAHGAAELRAMTGTIVSGTKGYELPGHPRVYELSFPCPRGLSGAALSMRGAAYRAIGIILGNRATDMIVYSETEITKDGAEYLYEKVESLRLGYAIQAEVLTRIESRLLGGPVIRT